MDASQAAEHLAANPDALASLIMDGDLPPSSAIGHPGTYDALTTGANGRLPFLGTSSKIDAGMGYGILTRVLYMMPADSSGREACAGRSQGCTSACLAEGTGRMSMTGPRRARRRKHAAFYADRGRFLADVHAEIVKHARAARKVGKVPAIRLNGTTDLPWHRMRFTAHDGTRHASLHAACPDVRFYEYTKLPLAAASKGMPDNLHLTFSVSERPDAETHASAYLAAGYGAAVVMATPKHALPATFAIGGQSWPVVDGDAHDVRFLDPAGSIVGLAAKGRAKHDDSGFVRAIR